MMLPQLTLYSDCELHLRVESAEQVLDDSTIFPINLLLVF
jgi:hypothetical protein